MSFYAEESPTFQPAMRVVTAITNDNPASVTTSFDHDYISGTIVRLYVPHYYGMLQANLQVGTIEVTGTDTFTINIDTTFFYAFAAPGTPLLYHKTAIVVPIGEINSLLDAAVRNVLPY